MTVEPGVVERETPGASLSQEGARVRRFGGMIVAMRLLAASAAIAQPVATANPIHHGALQVEAASGMMNPKNGSTRFEVSRWSWTLTSVSKIQRT